MPQQAVERALEGGFSRTRISARAALVSLHDDLDKRISRPLSRSRSRGGRKGGAAMMDLIVQRDGSRGIRRLAVQGQLS